MSYNVDTRGLDRVRWVLFFEILPRVAWDRPARVEDVYALVVKESKRLEIELSLRELHDILRELEARNIVKLIRDKDGLKVYLTEDAKYFLIIYRPHGV